MANPIVWHVLDATRDIVLGFGTVPPTANNGLDKAVGSLYVFLTGGSATLYQKTGAAATAWTATGGVPNPIEGDLTVDGVVISEGANAAFFMRDRATGATHQFAWYVAGSVARLFTQANGQDIVTVDESGRMKQNGNDVAKVIISTSPPSGTPASGIGTLWVQY